MGEEDRGSDKDQQIRVAFEFPSEYRVSVKAPEVDSAPNTPMARALRWVIADGKPVRGLSYLFFSGEKSHVAWLGAFALTDGDRVCFFPGFIDQGVRYFDGRKDRPSFLLDHVTLDADRKTWHMTGSDDAGKPHTSGGKTARLATSPLDGRVMWFGLTLQSGRILRPLARTTTAEALVPASDGNRRLELFNSVHDDAVHTFLDSHREGQGADNVWHFSFVVGSPSQELQIDRTALSPPLNALTPPVEALEGMWIRAERVHLSADLVIDVMGIPLPGKLEGCTSVLTSFNHLFRASD